jgi:hypothetical protein
LPEDGVQNTHELPHPSAAVERVGQAAEDCDDGRRRVLACPLNVLSPDAAIIADVDLGRVRRKCCRAQYVLDLVGAC